MGKVIDFDFGVWFVAHPQAVIKVLIGAIILLLVPYLLICFGIALTVFVGGMGGCCG